MRNRLKNYLAIEKETENLERLKEKPLTGMEWLIPQISYMPPRNPSEIIQKALNRLDLHEIYQKAFDEKSWKRIADILSKWHPQWYQLQTGSSFSKVMHELSETGKIEDLKERINTLEEETRRNKKLIEQISERICREEELDKEIVKDLKTLGGVPRTTKGDPFKLAKRLPAISREEYEEIRGED